MACLKAIHSKRLNAVLLLTIVSLILYYFDIREYFSSKQKSIHMALTMLVTFIFPPPPSVFITAISVITFGSLAKSGFSELRGKHMQYSKFWNSRSTQKSDEANKKVIEVSGRRGMQIAYTPAFLAALTSLVFFPRQDMRELLLSSALTLHFLKRILEVQFVHKYSGGMRLDTSVFISVNYFLYTACMTYAQHLTQGLPEPPVDLKNPGILLFLIGISGNFFHHYLLSRTRSKGDKEYKIPKGGLFSLVICPHYLFEIIGFVGVSFISQTLYAFSFTIGSAFYLMGRSYATRRWYLSKFKDFPRNVKALIPYVL